MRSENSSSVRRPSTTCSRSMVTVRSRSASAARSLRPAAPPRTAAGGWAGPPGSGRSAIGRQFAPFIQARSDLTTRQMAHWAAVRLVRRARDHQCGGLRALPAPFQGRHRDLHGQRRRQGHPGRGVARRGHDDPGGRGGQVGVAGCRRLHARVAVVLHVPAGVPGQDRTPPPSPRRPCACPLATSLRSTSVAPSGPAWGRWVTALSEGRDDARRRLRHTRRVADERRRVGRRGRRCGGRRRRGLPA